jgi:proline dehydrogenase
MLSGTSKAFFHLLSRSALLKKLASRYGIRHPSSFGRRFIAGETVGEAIEAARALEARGLMQTLDHLGESITKLSEADAATRDYLTVIEAVAAAGIGRNLSLKLTQLGLDVDKASAIDNLRRVLDRSSPAAFFVRIDMEGSAYTDVTLDIFETLWHHGYREMGIVLQAALYRSEQDLTRINSLGARIRLVKGAYQEPKNVAYQSEADVDGAYLRMARTLLSTGHYPAIATHDSEMIGQVRAWAAQQGIAPDRFEFQMLLGIRRDLQAALVRDGFRVRIYVPFGQDWFPYFMRRLGERPANVMFVLRSLANEAR